jgi:recombination protein RecR
MAITKVELLNDLITLTKSIPFVSSRYTLRLANHFLSLSESEVENFCETLVYIKRNLEKCSFCFCWKEKQKICSWCNNNEEKGTICIVETWIDVLSIQRAGIFNGLYHVLGGTISPLEGVYPENLSINDLIKRIKNGNYSELIFALNQTPESEATSFFIENLIKKENLMIKVSHIASGIPVGSSLEFIDKLTLTKALNYRR